MPGATTKKKTTTSKSTSSTKLTKKDEEILKKRLKKLLEKEGVKSKSKPSSSKSTAGCSGGSCYRSKSPVCSSGACYFTEKSKNKTTVAAKPKTKAAATKKSTTTKSSTAAKKTTSTTAKKKTTTASSSKEYSCSNGVCALKSKPKPKPKASSSKSSCADGKCFFLEKNTNSANKTNPTKVTSKKKAPEVKPKVVPAKKPKLQPVPKKTAASKSTKSALKSKPKVSTAKKAPIRGSYSACGDFLSSSEDYSDEEDDSSDDDEDQSSDTDESDFDDSDDDSDCCGGQRGSGPMKKGYSKKQNDSFEDGSWETDSGDDSFDCSGGRCGPNARKRRNFIGDGNANKDGDKIKEQVDVINETALVPVDRSTYIEEAETDDDNFLSEEGTDYSYDDYFEEGSEEETDEDMSYEDSEYSPADSSFDDGTDDEDYQLPDSEAEDVVVRKGEAKSYPMHNHEEIDFDSDASSLQVIEIFADKYHTVSSDNPPIEDAPEQKSEDLSDDSCPQLVPIDEDDYNDSDDSCPQLVSIEGTDYTASDLFYSSENDSEMEYAEEDVPKMRAHVFEVGTPDNAKTIEQDTSISALFKNNRDSLQCEDVIDYMSPLEKIANRSINVDSTNYKVITPGNSKRRRISTTDPNDDLILEPAEKKTEMPKDMFLNDFMQHGMENTANVSSLNNSSNCEVVTTGKDAETVAPEVVLEKESSSSVRREVASLFYNSVNSRCVLLVLKDRLYLYGTVKMKLITGELKVFGYSPELGETIEIFSPRGYGALYLEPATKNRRDIPPEDKLMEKLSEFSKDFLSNDLEEIAELFDHSTDTLVLLERNDQNKKVQMLRKYMKENLFPNMNSITLERSFYNSEFILRCLIYPRHDNQLKIDLQWDLVDVTSQSKMMIIGGKSVGKSTLVRYLINRNISKFKKFLLIDIDIGQPEVFIPQTVSATVIENPLIGPGYLQGLTPAKSYLFGDINVLLSPIAYLRKVKQLLSWCHQQEEFKNIPWIMNTMGYCKGFGSELISVIAQLLDPTDIVQIQSRKEYNNFDFVMTPEVTKTLPRIIFSNEVKADSYEPKHRLILFNTSVTRKGRSNEADFSAKDNRFAIVLSRIGTILTGRSEWLSDVKPVWAPIDNIEIICFNGDKVDKDDLVNILNANLVYLCGQSEGEQECYGIGIVRGIDRFHGKIYLLPAVPLQALQNVNTLAICSIPLPSSIMLNQGPKVKDLAPYTYNTNDSAASKHITPIHHRPLHMLHGQRDVLC